MPRHTSTGSYLKSRNAIQLTSAMEKKLLGYATLAAASGVAMLAVAPSAEAKVVYTATHQKLPLNATFVLDVNGDGIPDFNFFAGTILGGALRRDTYTFNSDATLTVSAASQSNQVRGAQFVASALPAGVKIGGDRKFEGGNLFMGAVSATDGGPPTFRSLGSQWRKRKRPLRGPEVCNQRGDSLRLGPIQRADSAALERQSASHTHGIRVRDGSECLHHGRQDIRRRGGRYAAGYLRAISRGSGGALIGSCVRG